MPDDDEFLKIVDANRPWPGMWWRDWFLPVGIVVLMLAFPVVAVLLS